MSGGASGVPILGVYITDDYIEALVGIDPREGDRADARLDVQFGDRSSHNFRVETPPAEEITRGFEKLAQMVAASVPEIRAVGVGAYGPFRSLVRRKKGYGEVLPVHPERRPMQGVNLNEQISNALAKAYGKPPPPVHIDTDVSCAALGEAYLRYTQAGEWMSDRREHVMAYAKVSLGIGGAICRSSNPYVGRHHSEMGQIYVRRWEDEALDPHLEEVLFDGLQPHPFRLEGLASAPAIEKRFGASFESLKAEPSHPAWDREAYYIAQLCLAMVSLLAPSNIVLGGRVLSVDGLLEKIRYRFAAMIRGEPNNAHVWFPDYPEMREPDFIDIATPWPDKAPGKPGLVGAVLFGALQARR